MSLTLGHLRRSLIVLATIFGGSLAPSAASACSMVPKGHAACSTVCGCCSPETNETRADVARPVAIPQAPVGCETSPGEACSCRSQEPAVPMPKPARGTTAEGRTELSQGSDFVPLGDDAAARITLSLTVSATQSPPKIPLYLRDERLLF